MNSKIPEGWKECKLGEVINFCNGKAHQKNKGDIPVYGGNGILAFCNQFNVNDKTIIIGRVGAYCGSIFYENRPIWISDNALFAKPKSGNNIEFFYHFLKNLNLNQFAEGSSHPLITQTLLNLIDIEIPKEEFEAELKEEERLNALILENLDKVMIE